MSGYSNNSRGAGRIIPAYAAAVPPIDRELRGFMLRVFNTMAGGLAVTGFVAYVSAVSGIYAAIAGTPLFWLVLLAPFGLALLLSFRIGQMSPAAAQAAFWGYAALMGLSLAGIFLVYTGTSIARVFFISAATFAATAAWGYATRTDLSRFGSFLVMGLIGVVLASLVNLFVGSSALQFALSVVGVVVFTGLAAWDTQRLKTMFVENRGVAGTGNMAIMGALMLYLDFVNLFISLLQLVGVRRD
jgi:FtsH-binding integral membrane protein